MMIGSLILFLAMAIPMGIAIVGLLLWRQRRRLDKRRSPLKDKVLNLPGENLRKQIAEHEDAYNEAAGIAVTIGPITLCVWLLTRMHGVNWGRMTFVLGDVLLVAVALGILGWCLWRLITHATEARQYREGLYAELAVAQSLAPLMAEGGLVFHDFPCDRFNIDHIVIGRSVVFAIETKSRKKNADKGRESVYVSFDGSQLKFPNGY